jgi:hypothetical protein
MKSLFTSSLLFMFIIISGSSCKKDSTTDDNPNIPVSGISTQLSKVYFMDTTLINPNDTIHKTSFTYDASNRLSIVEDFEKNIIGDSSLYFRTKYEYNGSDTFAFRTIGYTKDFSAPVRTFADTIYYSFLNGIRLADSSINSDRSQDVNKYTYFTDKIRRNRTSRSNITGTTIGGANIYQTKVNGNVTYQLDTLISTNGPNVYYQKYEVTNTFLTNPNPFYKLALANKKEYQSEFDGIFSGSEQKNILSQQMNITKTWRNTGGTGTGGGFIGFTYFYTFRNDGYPIEARVIILNNTTTKRYKIKYVYK